MRLCIILFASIVLYFPSFGQTGFEHEMAPGKYPWTARPFENDPQQFQFAIVSDRTGGHRAGVFGDAMSKLNRVHPEFVMSVGDLIEGYTKDPGVIDGQWEEFDSIASELNMRFFALPGNHDISNDVMREKWVERYGRSYYHFKYKNVLFLAFDSNDGDGVSFSDEQIDYFKKVISENTDVRWTMIFMHHPIWNYREINDFDEIEGLLTDKNYTVVAGHNHRYMKSVRQDKNYYILATTGGGSQLRGPRVGEFDHITWVTMTSDGPELVHLKLDGIIDDDVLNEITAPVALALHNAAQIKVLELKDENNESKVYLRISNTLPRSFGKPESDEIKRGVTLGKSTLRNQNLVFSGRFYHNHHVNPSISRIDVTIPPDSAVQIPVDINLPQKNQNATFDPLELDWTLGFEGEKFSPAFQLSGILDIDLEYEPDGIEIVSSPEIFLDQCEVTLNSAYENLEVLYTVNGGDPRRMSKKYTGPFTLSETSVVRARYYEPETGALSAVVEKEFRKVIPYQPVKVKKRKLRKGLSFTYFEGNFSENLPDFSKLQPMKSGIALHSDIEELAGRKDHFAMTFEGYIEIPEDGIYTFYLRSDDGSKLLIHQNTIVDNDGSHSARTQKGYAALEKGYHPIRIEYFEDFLGEELGLSYGMGNISPKKLSFGQMFHTK